VIEMAQMGHFVRDDVILYEGWRHDDAPAEHQRALGRAASPAGLCVAHGDARERGAGLRGFCAGLYGKAVFGFGSEQVDDTQRERVRLTGHVDQPWLQPGFAAPLGHAADQVRLAVDWDRGAVLQGRRLRQGGEGGGDPIGMFVQQCQPGCPGGARRQGDDQLPMGRIDAQCDPPCLGVPAPEHGWCAVGVHTY